MCFEFVPRHHNIIRFRKGLEMIREDFSTVCSYIQFKSSRIERDREWNYNLMLCEFDFSWLVWLTSFVRFPWNGKG